MNAPVRNRYRNQVGVGFLLSIVLWVVVLVGLWGTQVMVKQRMEDTRQRIVSMREAMGQVGHQIESVRTQQGALLNREALRRRLQAGGSALVPISLDKVHRIDSRLATEQGMAMGNLPADAQRRP